MRSPLVRPSSGQKTLSRLEGSTPPGTLSVLPEAGEGGTSRHRYASITRGGGGEAQPGTARLKDVTPTSYYHGVNGQRRCPRCQITKDLDEFDWRDAARTKPQSYCRDCSNAAWREWYKDEANRARHLAQLARRRRRRIARNRKIVAQFKSAPCADCGGSFPFYVMDFDHTGAKTAEVSSLVFTVSTAS